MDRETTYASRPTSAMGIDTSAALEARGPILSELDGLAAEMELLSHRLQGLEERLLPVIQPMPGAQKPGRAEQVQACSPVRERIADLRVSASNLRLRIEELDNCLEV